MALKYIRFLPIPALACAVFAGFLAPLSRLELGGKKPDHVVEATALPPVGPLELSAREGQLTSHMSVTFSPDSKQLMVLDIGGPVHLWDVHEGWEVLKFREPSESITTAHFAPDGKSIATTCTGNWVTLWDTGTGRPELTLVGHQDWVAQVSYSPDGRHLATISYDDTARIWNAQTGAQEALYREPPPPAPIIPPGLRWSPPPEPKDPAKKPLRWFTLVYSTDGSRIFASFGRGTKILDSRTAAVINTLPTVDQVTIGPDPTRMLGGTQFGIPSTLDTATGTKLVDINASYRSFGRGFFLPNHRVLLEEAEGNSRLIEIADALDGHVTSSLPTNGDRTTVVGASPDGSRIVTCGQSRMFDLRDTTMGKIVAGGLGTSQGGMFSSFSPDGKLLALPAKDSSIQIVSAATGSALEVLDAEAHFLNYWSVDSAGSRVLMSSANGMVSWDVSGRTNTIDFEKPKDFVFGSQFSRDGSEVVGVDHGGQLYVWDAKTGAMTRSILTTGGPYAFSGLSPDGTSVVIGSSPSGDLQLVSVKTGKVEASSSGSGEPIYKVSFSPEGDRIVASTTKSANIWGRSLGNPLLRVTSGQDGCQFAQLTSDGRHLVTVFQEMKGSAYSGPGMRWMYGMHGPGPTIKVWNASSGGLEYALPTDDNRIAQGAVAQDGSAFVTSSATATSVWDLETGTKLFGLPIGGSAIFSQDGKLIFVTDGNRTQIWLVDRRKLLYTRFTYGHGAWVVATPDGRYDSPEGAKPVNARLVTRIEGKPATIVPFSDQKAVALYRPSLATKVFDSELPTGR